jgi:predicted metal-dependent phosphoesterase TrpH
MCQESYSAAEQVYATLKRRGMDVVTLTDHDSIEGAEELRRYKDFFASEEVTCPGCLAAQWCTLGFTI